MNLKQIGLDPSRLEEAKAYEKWVLARVLEQHRDSYRILTDSGIFGAKVSGKMMFLASAPSDFPTVGDWIMVEKQNDIAIIHAILQRKSRFERKAAGKTSETQLIAANIDVIFICMSLNENFNLRRLERYLAIAWTSGATPVVILTKADLAPQPNGWISQVEQAAIGVDILICSEYDVPFFTELEEYILPGKTYAFIGSSGVGKSTIVNHLISQNIMKISNVGAHDKGRHTTTSRELFLTEKGSIVIDTPGMREMQIDDADLEETFQDIEELAKNCKFRDCRHNFEPGCAVKAAISSGALANKRLDNYRSLLRELAYQERRSRDREQKRK